MLLLTTYLKTSRKFNPKIQTCERGSNGNMKKLDTISFIRRKLSEWFGHARRANGQLLKTCSNQQDT